MVTYDIPFLTQDAGGFKEFDSRDLGDSLYVRWIQFSCFNPIMEVFSSVTNRTANLPYLFSERAQAVFRLYTQLRMRLFPYIYSAALRTRLDGVKMIRGDGVHPTQYLFGNAFLVAPVHARGAAGRDVYLPDGSWINYWTGERVEGGRSVIVQAPLETLPLFVRAGSIIPMRDYARAVELGTNASLTLDVYPAADGKFDLLEDDGTSNDYLSGGFAVIPFRMRMQGEAVRLSLGPARGHYKGMPTGRTFRIRFNGVPIPAEVRINGSTIPFAAENGRLEIHSSGWAMEPGGRTLCVKMAASTEKGYVVEAAW
jgi:alpha-glucosidase (family GH31 glycosyl hydrolase)